MWLIQAAMDPIVIALGAVLILFFGVHRFMLAKEKRVRVQEGEVTVLELKNNRITAVISEIGAECIHLMKNGESDVMWQRDPKYWRKCAPVLFPIVGRVAKDQYTYQGKTYSMGIHGFASDSPFEIVEHGVDYAWLELRDTEETRAAYPFPFSLRIGYHLVENTLMVTYKVHNPGTTEMIFTIGAHPGFLCDLENSELIFEGMDHLEVRRCEGPDNLLGYTRRPMPLSEGGRLPLSRDLFVNDAMILDVVPDRVGIARKNCAPHIWVRFDDFPILGVWTARNQSQYICIEPWYGHVDVVDNDGTLESKVNMMRLNPDQTFETVHSIELV